MSAVLSGSQLMMDFIGRKTVFPAPLHLLSPVSVAVSNHRTVVAQNCFLSNPEGQVPEEGRNCRTNKPITKLPSHAQGHKFNASRPVESWALPGSQHPSCL